MVRVERPQPRHGSRRANQTSRAKLYTLELNPEATFVEVRETKVRGVLLVGGARTKEVTMSRVSSAEKAKFEQAMADEWQKCCEFRTTKPLTEKKVKMFVDAGIQIVGTQDWCSHGMTRLAPSRWPASSSKDKRQET